MSFALVVTLVFSDPEGPDQRGERRQPGKGSDARCQLQILRNVRTDICLGQLFSNSGTQSAALWDLAGGTCYGTATAGCGLG